MRDWTSHRCVPRLEAFGWPARSIRRHVARRERIGNLRLRRLAEAQNGRCAYCTRTCWVTGLDERERPEDQATTEHVVPVIHGGSESPLNKVMACSSCNRWRGEMDVAEFMAVLARTHGPFIPRHLGTWLKREAKRDRRSRNAGAHEGYATLVLALAWLMYLDPRARVIADEAILANGRKRPRRIDRTLKRMGYPPRAA